MKNIQMPYIDIGGLRFGTVHRAYAQTAWFQVPNTAPYKAGKRKGHVQVNGEKITWEKIHEKIQNEPAL